ncbi:hypothetical protein FOXG_20053 [Fusarium oxysporum f. sp. lycopersici 4287]|uniref:Uncharacterized protein n=2 Tax=Fusarium oxysporum TaxID=5507 RepID=A0A0J9VB86_FUSO4|nr:hypothetical protein FOXG_20053 [Fusarium oxysporum f. sp. lycopersici 4287]EXK37641.1 hypothetical protein FOMG_08295 [Fusarium oxysporum f. sp. melonis 26406]KNB08689.1 hypothetical protein FOXG_20053 [Fusarium oxysporum f. sp. lycopersici 4287]
MRYAIIVPWDHEPRTIDYITALALATGNHERHVDINYTAVTLMSHAGERDEDENQTKRRYLWIKAPLGQCVSNVLEGGNKRSRQ